MVGERFKRPPRRRVTESHESRRAEPKAPATPSVGLPQRSSERAFHHEREFAFSPRIGRSVGPYCRTSPTGLTSPIRSSVVPRVCKPDADCRERSPTIAPRSTVRSVFTKVQPLERRSNPLWLLARRWGVFLERKLVPSVAWYHGITLRRF